jgi:hypothetical protein
LGEVSIRVAQGEWNNPIAWLDKGKGAFLRLQAHHPRAPQWPDLGGIDWDNAEQADAVLGPAEALARRTYNRWYAVCDYEGWTTPARL